MRAYSDYVKDNRSDGEVNYSSTIFAIEEPELYLHPQAQRTMMSVLREISSGIDQIIYSTQSNTFVDIKYFDEIAIVKRIKNEDEEYESIPTQLTIDDMLTDLKARKGVDGTEEGMRELYMNVFDPMVNEGFFADKVVIAEGPSEIYAFPIYGITMGYDFNKNNVSIVHSNGKGQMDRMIRIFNGFEIPTYLIFDGDKDHENKAITDKSIELCELMDDPIEDISEITTKVCNKYAVFEYNLERTLVEEIPDYDGLKQQAHDLMGSIGKPLVNKYIAKKLKESVDAGAAPTDIIPSTIYEILTRIQAVEYEGSLLQK